MGHSELSPSSAAARHRKVDRSRTDLRRGSICSKPNHPECEARGSVVRLRSEALKIAAAERGAELYWSHMQRLAGISVLALLIAGGTSAQEALTPVASPPTAEVTTRQVPVTFRTQSNLVSVPVVARDSKGFAVGNLTRDDFDLTDNGKRQTISRFAVEVTGNPTQRSTLAGQPPGSATPGAVAPPVAPLAMPDRFVAYFFDDVNLSPNDLAQAREAVERNLASLRPNERVALATTSGQNSLDFTADRDRFY